MFRHGYRYHVIIPTSIAKEQNHVRIQIKKFFPSTTHTLSIRFRHVVFLLYLLNYYFFPQSSDVRVLALLPLKPEIQIASNPAPARNENLGHLRNHVGDTPADHTRPHSPVAGSHLCLPICLLPVCGEPVHLACAPNWHVNLPFAAMERPPTPNSARALSANMDAVEHLAVHLACARNSNPCGFHCASWPQRPRDCWPL
jgi:hypothetical protein